jgi:hypothetical protein
MGWPGVVLGRVLLALSLSCGYAFAQNTNAGEIRGTVTDPSGAVVPSVNVVILNTQTGVKTQEATNASGIYDALSLVPGNYSLTFGAAGFSTVVRQGINLQAEVITVDVQLNVGATTSEVVVSGAAPLLKTEGAEQGSELNDNVAQLLPNVGQSWTNFTATLPGITGSGEAISVNGTERYEGNWLSDGGNIVLPRSNNLANTDVFETVAEVQITTASFNAQYSSGTAVFNQITKSGTNQFHGAAYDYTQNDALNARNFFSQSVPFERWDNFGGAVGGPIRKDKLFFYYNYDTTLSHSNGTGFSTYPTADMRAGNFSNPIFPAIYDPNSLATVNGQQVRQPFPGNQIPASELDPVAAKIQSYLPTPNLPGYYNNFYYQTLSTSLPFQQFYRVDYNISSSNRVNFSGTWNRSNSTPNSALWSPTYPISTTISKMTNLQGQITDVWTISPTVVNEFRAAVIRQDILGIPSALNQGYPQKLGIDYAVANLFPSVNIGGPVGSTGIGPGGSWTLAGNTYTPSDTITIIRGRHIIKAGAQYEANEDNGGNWGDTNAATFNFSGVFTAKAPFATGSGLGYADFLTGQVDSWSAFLSPVVGLRMKDGSFFVQDDYKIKPNLTLNLGLRYQIQGGWSEANNRMGIFDPTITNPATNTPGAMWYAGNNGRTALQKTIWDTFLPRIGFAWSPASKWSVRGGFGMYSHRWGTDVYGAPAVRNTTGFFTTGSMTETTQVSPVFDLSSTNPALNTYYPNPAARTPASLNGQPVAYFPYNTPTPKVYSWSFGIQRELQQGIVAEVSYVGNEGRNLSFPVDNNQVPAAKLGQGQSARPYPQFQTISGDNFNGISNYNGLQASLRKQFSQGISLNANYTWSKNLCYFDAAGWAGQAGTAPYQMAYSPAANYGLSNNDVPQAFKMTVVYQLPIGKGRALLGSAGGPLDAVLGGWQASGIFLTQSGSPFTPVMGTANLDGALSGTWYPNRIGTGTVSNATISEWFNPAAFTEPASLTFGDSGRNILFGPGMTTLNFSMGKNFSFSKLHEGMRLQFRMDATNILNHPCFSGPNPNIGASGVGTISGTTVGGRVVQLGARLSF